MCRLRSRYVEKEVKQLLQREKKMFGIYECSHIGKLLLQIIIKKTIFLLYSIIMLMITTLHACYYHFRVGGIRNMSGAKGNYNFG